LYKRQLTVNSKQCTVSETTPLYTVNCTLHTLVLSLGNPLRGDDGVGTAVLTLLAAYPIIPPEVVLLDGGTPGLETVLLLEGYEKVIIIDAADMGLEPGAWRRFSSAKLAVQEANLTGTLHQAGLAEALALAEALNMLPDEVIVFGIQPAEIGWEPGLSVGVETAVSEVCKAILAEFE
jgi:hydrogenase maturation protease